MANLNAVKFLLAAFGCGILLVACGDDVTMVTEVSKSGLEVVVSADSLGKCTAASSGEMKFASKENAVFVCADSAWKNVSAAEKASCSAESLGDSSGYKIVCGGDSVGVIFNGKDGKNGEAGKAGTSCTITETPLLDSDFGHGGYLVICGGDTVGTLRDGLAGEGCSVTDNGDGSVSQVCGPDTVTLYKAFCGGKVYDPDSSFCYENSVVARCGGESYELSESFCFGDSIYALCGGDRFAPETEFCYNDSIIPLCNGKSYSLDSSFCYGDSVVALCGGKIYDLQDSVCHEERLFGFFEDARDKQLYRTVQIGNQIWMAENLNYAYPKLMLSEADSTESAGADSISFCYGNDPTNCETYGRLYTWAAAMDSAAIFSDNGKDCGYGKTCSPTYPVCGVCPVGWHLPSKEEWQTLKNFITKLFGKIDSVGYALKSTSGWNDFMGSKSGNGSDAFGFGTLPAGRLWGSIFYDVFIRAMFWNSTEYGANEAFYYEMYNGNSFLAVFRDSKDNAYSIRCVKDN